MIINSTDWVNPAVKLLQAGWFATIAVIIQTVLMQMGYDVSNDVTTLVQSTLLAGGCAGAITISFLMVTRQLHQTVDVKYAFLTLFFVSIIITMLQN